MYVVLFAISFLANSTLQRIERIDCPEYSDYVAINTEARAVASEIVKLKK